jgi:hypothetical protein
MKIVYGRTYHPQSQGKIERFNQTLGQHLTKMLWNEVNKVQGYQWIDILPAFVLAYNKAPHEAHKKSLYKAFFGFKMREVYATPTMQVNESGETTLTAAQVDESGETTLMAAQVDELGKTTLMATQVDESGETTLTAAQVHQEVLGRR